MEGAIRSCYNWGGISRGLFKAVILAEGYNKEWRDLDKPNWSSYIGGEMWRKLFGALIVGEGSREACSKHLY